MKNDLITTNINLNDSEYQVSETVRTLGCILFCLYVIYYA